MRRDEDANELRSDILRKNALIADLTAMNKRKAAENNGHVEQPYVYDSERHQVSATDGAVELELAQTKVICSMQMQTSLFITSTY